MIRVCDAIMGTGKSSASITYMNEHKWRKFIYITPYLDEAERIRNNCPDLHFVEPSNKLREYDFRKRSHTAALISEGRNIATTHQSFKSYTPDMLDEIRKKEYTLMIDESVDVLETADFYEGDLQMAVDAGYVVESNGVYREVPGKYRGGVMNEMFQLLHTRELVRLPGDGHSPVFFWALPPDLFTSFKDVFIMTYMFSGQSLHHFLNIYNLPYEYIGIERDGDTYRFGEYPGYIPGYVSHLSDMIDIIDNERLNMVGGNYTALSKSWYDRKDSGADDLKKDVSNFYNNIWRDIPASRRMTGTYKDGQSLIRGAGYSKSFIPFNAKATNAYRERDCLAYPVNVFMNVNEKRFYKLHGIDVDEDAYATSIMVQWIWRSAIRDGKKIHIYIPSSRMRGLLRKWIDHAGSDAREDMGIQKHTNEVRRDCG